MAAHHKKSVYEAEALSYLGQSCLVDLELLVFFRTQIGQLSNRPYDPPWLACHAQSLSGHQPYMHALKGASKAMQVFEWLSRAYKYCCTHHTRITNDALGSSRCCGVSSLPVIIILLTCAARTIFDYSILDRQLLWHTRRFAPCCSASHASATLDPSCELQVHAA